MISDEAVEAAATVLVWEEYHGLYTYHPEGHPKRDDVDRYAEKHARAALEAAAPHMLKDMRPMTLVEIAHRDRPESMGAARNKILAERRESQAERIREAKASGFDLGFTACAHEHMKQDEDPSHPITRVNPFGETFADRMARQSLEAMSAKYPEPRHSMHKEGEWFYACEACSGLPEAANEL